MVEASGEKPSRVILEDVVAKWVLHCIGNLQNGETILECQKDGCTAQIARIPIGSSLIPSEITSEQGRAPNCASEARPFPTTAPYM